MWVGRACGMVRGCVFVPVGDGPVILFSHTYHTTLISLCFRACSGTRRLIPRTCKVFRIARKLSTAPADLESRPRAPQRVGLGLGLGSGHGSGWSGQRNRRFVWTCTKGAAIHESLLNLRANLKNLARTCNFTGAPVGDGLDILFLYKQQQIVFLRYIGRGWHISMRSTTSFPSRKQTDVV